MKQLENDLLLNIATNPNMSVEQFQLVGLNVDNTSLDKKETYMNNEKVQEMFTTPDGNFDLKKFDDVYNTSLKVYNYMAMNKGRDLLADQITYHRANIFEDDSKKRKGPDFQFVQFTNPDMQKHSTIQLGITEKPTMTRNEIAQTQQVYDSNTGEFTKEATNDLFFEDFFRTKVRAVYENNEDDEGNIYENPDDPRITHRKGEDKLNEDGLPYYEYLNGRSTVGKQVLNKMDVLTTDGSSWNKYDFFDSDGFDKSTGGTIMKNLALVGSMFIPYVGPVITGLSVAQQATNMLSVLGKMALGSDVKFLNNLEGFTQSIGMETSSEYAKEHMFSLENMINLIGNVVAQQKQQRFIFDYAPALFGNAKYMDAKGFNVAKAEKAFMESEQKLLQPKMDELLKKASQSADPTDISNFFKGKAELDLIASNNAGKKLKDLVDKTNNLSGNIATAYMVGITSVPMYNEAKMNGASDLEASILTLGYMAGEGVILKSDIGQHLMPELQLSKVNNKNLANKLADIVKGSREEGLFPVSAKADSKQKLGFFKKWFEKGKDLATQGYVTNNALKAISSHALAESVEEVSEEVWADAAKGMFNLASWIRGDDTTFTVFDKDTFGRYMMSALGGAIGGGIMGGATDFRNLRLNSDITNEQAIQELVRMERNGELNKFKEQVNSLDLGNKQLSAYFYDEGEDGQKTYHVYDSENKDDISQDDYIKRGINLQIDLIQKIARQEGIDMSDESFLKQQDLSDLVPELKLNLLEQAKSTGRLLQRFNSVGVEIYKTRKQLMDLEDENLTDLQERVKEKEEKNNSTYIESEKKRLEEKLEKLRKERNNLVEGKYAADYMTDALFEMTPMINGVFTKPTFIQYVESQEGKPYNKITKDIIEYHRKNYEAYNDIYGKDNIHIASNTYLSYARRLSDKLNEIKELEIESGKSKYSGKFNDELFDLLKVFDPSIALSDNLDPNTYLESFEKVKKRLNLLAKEGKTNLERLSLLDNYEEVSKNLGLNTLQLEEEEKVSKAFIEIEDKIGLLFEKGNLYADKVIREKIEELSNIHNIYHSRNLVGDIIIDDTLPENIKLQLEFEKSIKEEYESNQEFYDSIGVLSNEINRIKSDKNILDKNEAINKVIDNDEELKLGLQKIFSDLNKIEALQSLDTSIQLEENETIDELLDRLYGNIDKTLEILGEESYKLIDSLLETIEKSLSNSGYVNKLFKKTLSDLLKSLSKNNYDAYLASTKSLPINQEVLENEKNTIFENIENSIEFGVDELKAHIDYLAGENPTAEEVGIATKYFLVNKRISDLIGKIDKVKTTPIFDLLEDLIVDAETVENPNIKNSANELLRKIQEIYQAGSFDNFSLFENHEKQINETLNALDILKAVVRGSQVDNGDITNIYGFNRTLNRLHKANDNSNWEELAEIDTNIAENMIAEIETLQDKLKFYKKLSDINSGQKANRQKRVGVNLNVIIYERLKKLVDSLTGFGGADELKKAIAEAEIHKKVKDGDLSKSLSKEQLLELEKERFNISRAIYNLFQLNQDDLDNLLDKMLYNNLSFIDTTDDFKYFTDESEKIDDNQFFHWLASRAALNIDDFYNEMQGALDGTIAPLPLQEESLYVSYANIANKKIFKKFNDAYKNMFIRKIKEDKSILDFYKKEYKGIFDILFDFDNENNNIYEFADVIPIFHNTVLIEGRPGTGKTNAVMKIMNLMIMKNHPELVNYSAAVSHGANEESAKKLISEIGLPDTVKGLNVKKLFESILTEKSLKNLQSFLESKGGEFSFTKEGFNFPSLEFRADHPQYKILFIDEVTKFSKVELYILNKYAELNNLSIIAAGDTLQSGVSKVIEFKTDDNEDVKRILNLETSAFDFVRAFKQGVSIRTGNSLMTESINSMSLFLEEIESGNNAAKLLHSYFYDEDERDFKGVIRSMVSNKEYNLGIIKAMLSDISDGDKIGIIIPSNISDNERKSIEARIKEITDLNPGKFQVFENGSAQGLESDYYIIFDNIDSENYNPTMLSMMKDLYTGISRSKKGTLILSSLSSPNFISLKKAKFYKEEVFPIEAIKKYTDERLEILSKTIENPKPIKIIGEDGLEVKVDDKKPTTIYGAEKDGELIFVELENNDTGTATTSLTFIERLNNFSENILSNKNNNFYNSIFNSDNNKINPYLYSHNTLIDNLLIDENGLVNELNSESNIVTRGTYGLYKLYQKLQKNIQVTEILNEYKELRSKLLYSKNIDEINAYIKDKFGDGFKIQLAYRQLEYIKYKDQSGQLLGLNTDNTDTMIPTNTISYIIYDANGNEVLEVPMFSINNPITLITHLREKAGITDIPKYDREKHKNVNEYLKENEKILENNGYSELVSFLKYYVENKTRTIHFKDNKALADLGLFQYTEIRTKVKKRLNAKQETLELVVEQSLEDFVENTNGIVSDIKINTQEIEINGIKIKPGISYVLYSPDSNDIYFENEKVIPIYVVPPKADLSDFIRYKIASYDKNKDISRFRVGNAFLIYKIMYDIYNKSKKENKSNFENIISKFLHVIERNSNDTGIYKLFEETMNSGFDSSLKLSSLDKDEVERIFRYLNERPNDGRYRRIDALESVLVNLFSYIDKNVNDKLKLNTDEKPINPEEINDSSVEKIKGILSHYIDEKFELYYTATFDKKKDTGLLAKFANVDDANKYTIQGKPFTVRVFVDPPMFLFDEQKVDLVKLLNMNDKLEYDILQTKTNLSTPVISNPVTNNGNASTNDNQDTNTGVSSQPVIDNQATSDDKERLINLFIELFNNLPKNNSVKRNSGFLKRFFDNVRKIIGEKNFEEYQIIFNNKKINDNIKASFYISIINSEKNEYFIYDDNKHLHVFNTEIDNFAVEKIEHKIGHIEIYLKDGRVFEFNFLNQDDIININGGWVDIKEIELPNLSLGENLTVDENQLKLKFIDEVLKLIPSIQEELNEIKEESKKNEKLNEYLLSIDGNKNAILYVLENYTNNPNILDFFINNIFKNFIVKYEDLKKIEEIIKLFFQNNNSDNNLAIYQCGIKKIKSLKNGV